eukprot:GHVH01008179.1.p1 GENE.GHVH01008179.1~~GHVH01008179.1.p1  ORF type:complete len:223 (-),score=36.78 GHVH01008179.1:61-729(-)
MSHLPSDWSSSKIVWSMDASSNFCSKPLKVSNYGIIYAGAQKNVGTSGITVALVEKDRFSKGPAESTCPSILDYSLLLKNKSLHTTIPVFPMYLTGLIAEDLAARGGLAAAEDRAVSKSDILYNFIDNSDGFYQCKIDVESRSRMNHVFRICRTGSAGIIHPSTQLESKFVSEATRRGLIGLKGHRSVGGLRASLYNAVPVEHVVKLVDFMKEFQEKEMENE